MNVRAAMFLRYLWAAPATMIGLALGTIAYMLGATVRVKNGVLEVAGGRLARVVSARPHMQHLLAITFGHVIIGISHKLLADERAHEHAHVRQYERWGLLLFPLYITSSLVQIVRGRHPYWHNRFELQAFQAAASQTGSSCVAADAHDKEKHEV
jgi:hypothetical protein